MRMSTISTQIRKSTSQMSPKLFRKKLNSVKRSSLMTWNKSNLLWTSTKVLTFLLRKRKKTKIFAKIKLLENLSMDSERLDLSQNKYWIILIHLFSINKKMSAMKEKAMSQVTMANVTKMKKQTLKSNLCLHPVAWMMNKKTTTGGLLTLKTQMMRN